MAGSESLLTRRPRARFLPRGLFLPGSQGGTALWPQAPGDRAQNSRIAQGRQPRESHKCGNQNPRPQDPGATGLAVTESGSHELRSVAQRILDTGPRDILAPEAPNLGLPESEETGKA